MRQILKIVGQIYKKNFFPLLFFVCLHRALFYGGLRYYSLLQGIDSAGFSDGWPWFLVLGKIFFQGVYISFFVLWEIAAYLLLYQQCYKSGPAAFCAMVFDGVRQVLAICRWRNIGVLPYLLLVLPFQVVMTWSWLYLSLEIPHFILQFLSQSPLLLACSNLLLLAVQIWGIMGLFFFHFLFLRGNSVLTAWKDSRQMGIWRLGVTCLYLLLWSLFWSLGSFLFYLGGAAAAFLLPEGEIAFVLVDGVEKLILFCQQCFFVPVSVAIVHSCYLLFFQGKSSLACPTWLFQKKKALLFFTGCLVAAVGCGCFIYAWQWQADNEGLESSPIIAAHRGYTEAAPENTISAILAAKEMGVSCLEIDVQMTEDGRLVLFHDRDLHGILGISKTVGALSYADLKALVDNRYADVFPEMRPLPLLEDALTAGGAGMQWNIEIKSYPLQTIWDALEWEISRWAWPSSLKKENRFANREKIRKEQLTTAVITLLEERGMEDNAMISSLDYGVLQLVKGQNPHIKTLYILPFAGSFMRDMPAADGYSIEITALRPEIYREVKRMKKSLWVWTVNDGAAAGKLCSYHVDGVITDRPQLLQRILNRDIVPKDKHFFAQFLFS